MVGKRLSHYKILQELGRGGMGIVYKAEDTKLDRTVAIKVLPSAALSNRDDRERFYREAKAAAQLHHPHIASVFEIDEAVPEGSNTDDLRPFIAMEFIDGETLDAHVRKGPMKLSDAVRIASEIAEALKAAHAKNIVHRDIKSANVMLDTEGRAKVLDFGLAKTAQSTKLTRMGSTLGTMAYMSPEQARGEEVDHRTDIWALGAVLYEMVSGRHPFPGDYEQAVVYSILNEDPEPLTAVRTGVPMELESIASKALRKKAAQRYQSAAGLIADLSTIDTTTTSQTRIRPPSQAFEAVEPERSKKSKWILPVAIGALMFVLGWLIQGLFRAEQPIEVRRYTEQIPGLSQMELSRDGSNLAFVAGDTLWIRSLETSLKTPVSVFKSSNQYSTWAPSSDRLALVDGDEVRTIRVDGSSETVIGRIPPNESITGLSWTTQDSIYISVQYGGASGEIFSIFSEGGGLTSRLKSTATVDRNNVLHLEWIPGPDILVAAGRGMVDNEESIVFVPFPVSGSGMKVNEALGSSIGADDQSFELAYDQDGYLLIDRESGIWVLEVDPNTFQPRGNARILVPNVAFPSVGSNGVMVAGILDQRQGAELVLVDPKNGQVNTTIRTEEVFGYPAFNSNGSAVVGELRGGGGTIVVDLVQGDTRRIAENVAAVSQWLPRDLGILIATYSGDTGADILVLNATGVGSPKPLIAGSESEFYASLSPDEKHLVYYTVDPETDRDLWIVDVDTGSGELTLVSDPVPWYQGPSADVHPIWHPSGNWIAYGSNQTGEYRIYTRPYPAGAPEVSISVGNGTDPAWSPDGSAIYYRDADSLYAVDILDQVTMRRSRPRGILSFEARNILTSSALNRSYAVHPVTGEILLTRLLGDDDEPSVIFIENWKGLLK